jgi:hypothetical protein
MYAVCLVLLLSSLSFAATTPFKLSLVENIAIPPTDDVSGVEIGLIGSKVQTLKGVQFNGIYDRADDGFGAQIALFNKVGKFTGMQYGVVNIAGTLSGLQLAFFNKAEDIKGSQLGFINLARQASGLQFGFLNKTTNEAKTTLFQLGLINLNRNSSLLRFFPFINFQF